MLEPIDPLKAISTLQPSQINTTGLNTGINENESEARELERKKEKAAMYFENMPLYYKKMTFENFKQTEKNIPAYNAAMAFVNASEKGLFLFGSCGSGKTHLAASAWQELIKKYARVDFIEAPELMMVLRKSFESKEGDTDEDIINRYAKPKYLIIDDFGADRSTAFAEDCFYLLLNRRLTALKYKIFITSNKSLGEYAKTVSDRIASRIAEMCDIVNLNDFDHRIKK